MITPIPDLAEPAMAFESANAFYGDRLQIAEEAEFVGPLYSAEPYVLIGYDGQAWRIQETLGPPLAPRTVFEKILTAILGQDKSPSIVARDVTPLQFSLDEFKGEVLRRIPLYPNAVFDDELLAGEGLPSAGDLERLTAALIERVSVKVQAATSIPGVMDILLEAQRDCWDWAEEFHCHPAVSP